MYWVGVVSHLPLHILFLIALLMLLCDLQEEVPEFSRSAAQG